MKKVLSLLLILSMLALPQAFADYTPIPGASQVIGASGSLGAVTSFEVNVVGGPGTALTFNYNESNGETTAGNVVQAGQTVEILFSDNSAGYQSVIITTDNENNGSGHEYTGEGFGAGLVNTGNTLAAAPLHWTVFDDRGVTSNDYTDPGSDAYNFGADIDLATEFYVIDKKELRSVTGTVLNEKLGYATVISGVSNQSGSLANVPYSDGADPRAIDDGDAYMRIACDYDGQEAGNYVTDTLTLELVTIS